MSRAFLICPEPVRAVTAGVGTRFLTLAQVLAEAGHEVTLAVPNDPDEAAPPSEGVKIVKADPERLGEQAGRHDWVLLHGHLGNHYLSQRDDLPVVVDLYDPFLVENLHYHRELGFEPFTTDHATWRLQMARGDLSTLERLIVELPFGVPEGPPPPPPARSDVLAGVEDGAPVLYFVGIYDWYDPEVVLAALPTMLERNSDMVLVFVEHPHPELTPLTAAARTRKFAEKLGLLGSNVRFEAWRPFDRRFELAQVSDLAVVTHRPGLETDLSLRTRLVDLMWLGLPAVVTAGGVMAGVVGNEGAGAVIPAGDPSALAVAVNELLADDDRRHRASEAARSWAAGRRWRHVASPLLEFAAAPRRDPHRERFDELAPGAVVGEEPLLRRIQRALRRQRGGR
ncbi:MAG: glycosyltransferase [Acidobacteria bacterium]|nr:glycosyltransferase [Candidatus Sulfomarinibacter sp. MAG AM1]